MSPVRELKAGAHLCCIYETEEEWKDIIVPFIKEGLCNGEKVFYAVDKRSAELILNSLRPELDIETFLNKGQFSIFTSSDVYLKGGFFDPERMISLLKSETKKALHEGYEALRVTGEMTWVLKGFPGSERLIEYESLLNNFFSENKCLAICQYDRRKFTPELLLDVLRTHPLAIIGKDFYKNFYYIPPKDMLSSGKKSAELSSWIEHLKKNKEKEKKIEEFNKNLKSRVEERTSELKEVNRKLEREIIEHQKTLEKLKKSRQKLKLHVEQTPLAVIEWDLDFRVVHCNPGAEKIFGYSPEEAEGRHASFILPEAVEEEIDRVWNELIKQKGGRRNTNENIRKDGKIITCEWYNTPLVDNKGEVIGVASLAQDITDRILAEKELKEAQEALARKEKLSLLGQMAGTLGHELKNPLGVISNAVYFLKMIASGEDNKIREYIDIIDSEIMRANGIISDLRNFSRVRTSAEREKTSLFYLISEVIQRLKIPENIEVNIDIKEDFPPVYIDPRQIEQVFLNLITNAFQAMPEGGIVAIEGEEKESQAVICVRDSGTGISSENLDKIFEPLFTTKSRGIGLGLFVCKNMVEVNDGKVEVYSNEGKGTTFRVVFSRKAVL